MPAIELALSATLDASRAISLRTAARGDLLSELRRIARHFLGYVEKTDSCWIWKGARNSAGYGIFAGGPAHRVSHILSKGPVPAGLVIRHHCDNPPCVNPAHLDLGTHFENTHDALRRGRTGSKLGPLAVAEIKRLKKLGVSGNGGGSLFSICCSYFDEIGLGNYEVVSNDYDALDPARGMPAAGPCRACNMTGIKVVGYHRSIPCAACEGTKFYTPGGRSAEQLCLALSPSSSITVSPCP